MQLAISDFNFAFNKLHFGKSAILVLSLEDSAKLQVELA